MKSGQMYCVIDCRVSDPQQLKGGSLDNQEMIGRSVAEKLGLQVAKVFKKPHSATTTEREDFKEIIDYIKKSDKRIGVYIVKSLDRLTREGYTEYARLKSELEKLHVRVVDSEGVVQPKKNTLEHLGNFEYKWSVYSPSEAGEMLETYKGKAEVRDILTRMIGAEIKLVQEGYAVRRAPDGLINKKIIADGKKKIIRGPDPERSIFFQKMFELLAEGVDYLEVTKRINAMGFKTRSFARWDRSDKEHPKMIGKTGGNPLTVKQLQRYIRQTEYAGVIYEKWTKHRPIKAKWEGIISVDTFNKANRGLVYIKINTDESVSVLRNYSPWDRIKRMKDNPNYPWKCIVCPVCRSEMLGSASKGKSGDTFKGYHCGGMKSGKRIHKYIRIPNTVFEKNIRDYLDSLKFDEGFLAGLQLHLLAKYREKEKDILLESSAISRSVSDLKIELARKLESFELAESPITRRILEGQIENLDKQINDAEEERGQIEITERSIRSFVRYAKYVMEHPSDILTGIDNLHSRRALLGLFFEEVPTYQEILNGTPKLQPLFRLSEQFRLNKTQCVSLCSANWNQIIKSISVQQILTK